MNIHIAADHAGYKLKESIKKILSNEEHFVTDHGALEYDALDDYPDFIFPAANAVANDKNSRGIIFGGSGQGEAMAANRIKGIRAAVFYGGNKDIPTLSRHHNDANILVLPGRYLDIQEAKKCVDNFLSSSFKEGRHLRRIKKIIK